jgi:hypothetical protein
MGNLKDSNIMQHLYPGSLLLLLALLVSNLSRGIGSINSNLENKYVYWNLLNKQDVCENNYALSTRNLADQYISEGVTVWKDISAKADLLRLSRVFSYCGQHYLSILLLEKYSLNAPYDVVSIYLLGHAYLNAGLYKNALHKILDIVRKYPDASAFIIYEANLFKSKGAVDEHIALLKHGTFAKNK